MRRRLGFKSGQFSRNPVRPQARKKLELPASRSLGATVGKVCNNALVGAVDCGMGLLHEALQAFRKPVITASLLALTVHSLLHYGPATIIGDNETVQVQIKTVLNRGAVHLCNKAACSRKRSAVKSHAVPDRDQLLRRLPRILSAPAPPMKPKSFLNRFQPTFERADHARGDARRVPIHAHHRAKGLEPEWMRQTPQELVAPIMMHDGVRDDGAKSNQAVRKPSRDGTAVQRQIA